MRIALAFVGLFLSLISYVILAVQFGVNQHYPIVHYILALVFLAWMAVETRKHFKILKTLPNLLGWLLFGLFVWWTASYSNYDQPVTVATNDIVPLTVAEIQDHEGSPVVFESLLERKDATLLVFFRGYW